MDSGRILRDAGLRPRKGLGQNFLTDRSVPPRIVAAAELAPDATVVEVGPGLGVLTAAIAEQLDPATGCLVAVELDESLLPLLRERMAPFPHFHLVPGDILRLDPTALVATCRSAPGTVPYHVIANLPYYITSAVLRHFLEAVPAPARLVVMVQREVALRMVAMPPEMSLLAVSVQFYGAPRIVLRVPPGAFHPPPKVESAVVRVDVYPPDARPVAVADPGQFFAVARAGFGQKRKQLVNSLAEGLGVPKPEAGAALAAAGIAATRRAETLTLAEWAALAAAVRETCNVQRAGGT
ncbi:MAG TPA: 16S rRNA (adenine(1518)-N(6)/adenine(1519)-N(6))-dimethyltransferase RsmA [Chloroflexia bacterium]|nr:16S rRNA (adenine(1518)-N(6)/adenine(1519)-N(6))-dimethyltransferase RsmA [Chloroflexia bacterium]